MAGAKIGTFYFGNVAEVLTPTPSDTVDFPLDSAGNPRGYEMFYPYIAVGGNVVFKDTNGVTRTITAVVANTTLPIPITRLLATGTTATVWALIPKAGG